MILLFSSAGEEIFKQFILEVLCYPSGYLIVDVPYSVGRVEDRFVHRPADLERKRGVMVFVDYAACEHGVEPCYLPFRLAKIERAQIFAGKLLLDLRLGEYIHYDDDVKRSYVDNGWALSASRLWNKIIAQQRNAPHVVARDPAHPLDPRNPATWKSGGKFVIEVGDATLDFQPDQERRDEIRRRCEDWKSTIDMLADRTQLRDKLFYQIRGLVRPGKGDGIPLNAAGGQAVYDVRPGDSFDLMLHFYYGDKKRQGTKRVLEVTTESGYLATLGRTAIDVYPEQISGKIERLRLVVKRQLSEEFTRVMIQEKDAPRPSLVGAEVYLHIRPRWLYVWLILGLFFLGALANALPTEWKWVWLPKVVGSLLMAVSFWLAFSKFPSK